MERSISRTGSRTTSRVQSTGISFHIPHIPASRCRVMRIPCIAHDADPLALHLLRSGGRPPPHFPLTVADMSHRQALALLVAWESTRVSGGHAGHKGYRPPSRPCRQRRPPSILDRACSSGGGNVADGNVAEGARVHG